MKYFKRTTLLCLLAVCAWTSALAWHEYQPMVVEGRRWDVGPDCSYIIEGDTICNNLTYKKVYLYEYDDWYEYQNPSSRKLVFCLREADKKVYIYKKGSNNNWYEHLYYDFSLGVVKNYSQELEDEVSAVVNTVIQGQERRVAYVFGPNWSTYRLLIEGIGYNSGVFPPFQSILWCYDGDKLLFDIQTDSFDNLDHVVSVIDGEVNGDDSVDIGDVNAVIDMMLGRPMQPRWDDVAADMDLSGALDIADVNAIIDQMLGKR